MKNILTQLCLIVFAVLFFAACSNTPKVNMGEVDIKDGTPAQLSGTDTAGHQPFTVDVFITASLDSTEKGYRVNYYQTENGVVAKHGAIFGSGKDFNKAAYRWLSDTSVSIRLMDTKTGAVDSFKVYGTGSRNGMSTQN